ncbi:MAG: BLUF domain-containing protein [Burkholderiaceae bacterium]
MLMRLIYASTAVDGVDMNEFKRILDTAQKNNTNSDLTGMLCFNSKIFLQALEGSREAINTLYGKLNKDPRHYGLTLIKYEPIQERHWPDWSMAFAAASTNNKRLYLKYGMQSVFNPYGMQGDQVEKLMMEMAQANVTTMKVGEEQAANESKGGFFARFAR